ncbi:ribonuclease 2-like [Humulus lupulus]|uniref:ribonuclease 2-like n=1 Tax=Humulus lupulus TaxID=3486 RepID=UPI002B4185CA|nr:ribonuclease 2-like [Humulus lupulus]
MALLFAKFTCLIIVSMASLAKSRYDIPLSPVVLTEEEKSTDFGYFVLSHLWPATSCRQSRHCCPSNACCRGSNAQTEFTIHGLWPNYNDGTWPACCSQKSFDEKEVSTLLDTLKKYWPTYGCFPYTTCDGGEGSFWAHEWEKHGTCSSPVVWDEYSYFLTTLNLYFKYNVTRILNEEGYVASNTEKYPLGGIISAIQNAFHATPWLVCDNGAVEELRLCFYKDFKPRDCVIESSQNDRVSSSSCPDYVSLPSYVPLRVGTAENAVPWVPEAIEELGSM